jgi:iron complex outermembrane receptor protein
MNLDSKKSSRQPRPRPAATAVRLACAALCTASVAQAQTSAPATGQETTSSGTTLPAVKATAAADKDGFVSQGRPASVGKSQVSVQETPFSISTVDVQQAREMGAVNIEGALLYSGGVYAGRYGFDTRGDWAGVRGLTPSTYLDGLRSLYGSYNNVRPELYTLERIEVLKGPSSALYGQADLGGIVNLNSKLPQQTPANEIEVQLGSHNRKQIAADSTGTLNEDGSLLYRIVGLARNSDTQVDYVNDDALAIAPSLSWRPNAGTNVTLLYVFQENKSKVSSQFLPGNGTLSYGALGQVPSNRFAGEPDWDRYDTRKSELTLLVDQRLNENWRAKANVRKTNSASVTREIYAVVGAAGMAANGDVQRTITTADRSTDVFASDLRLEGDLRLGPTRHRPAIGFDYQNALWEEWNYVSSTLPGTFNLYNPVYGTVDFSTIVGADRPDSKIVQSGYYISDHMDWGPVAVSATMRYDHASNYVIGGVNDGVATNDATTGQIGVMYNFPIGVSPYASYSEAFAPNLGLSGAGANARLDPTTGTQKEVGVKYLSKSGNTSVAVAWFDITQKGRLAAGGTPGGVEQTPAMIDGFEVELRQRFGALELMGNYTQLDAMDGRTNTRLSSVAERMASAWVQYHLPFGLRAGLGARYTGDVTGSLGAPIAPSVTQYDAMLGFGLDKWDVRFNVQNLTDEEYISWCRGPTINYDCGYGARRNATLTASYKF